MLFGAIVVAFVVMRYRHASSWPMESGGLPVTLWVSTAILLFSSLPLYGALCAVRADDQAALRRGLLLTTGLGFAFLVGQTVSWIQLFTTLRPAARATIPVFTFYMFTVTHALHVLGGLVPLCFVTVNACQGRYDSIFHPGVQHCNTYWHYLAVVWAVLFALLVLYT